MEYRKYLYKLEEINLVLEKEKIAVYGVGDYGRRVIDYIVSRFKE